ncbi:hypothetical protein [Tabrizicola sp.]|uniref:hypothetical protein n=1 Tax=Tabrizicola sp. TaxID=2005166 RepID=UPI00286C244F|nr:hypothetical protein [Tabrizicola sp.]
MTMPDDDASLDRLIRDAARTPFDETAVTKAVLSRLDHGRPVARTRARPAYFAPTYFARAAFASLLVATPLVIANYPAADPDAFLVAVASGDPLALFPDAGLLSGLLILGEVE